jgi:hypothetical protein
LGKLIGFFKSLFEHKEKVVLGVLLIAFIWVSVAQWDEIMGGGSGEEIGNSPAPKPSDPPRVPQKYGVPKFGNEVPPEDIFELVNAGIFTRPEDVEPGDADKPKVPVWAKINIRSIFDATQSGSFIAIIDVDNIRKFVKEGETFGDYTIKRIDGVKSCITLSRRGSAGSEDTKEFCK